MTDDKPMLDPIDHIRLRPGMYVGVNAGALHVYLTEMLIWLVSRQSSRIDIIVESAYQLHVISESPAFDPSRVVGESPVLEWELIRVTAGRPLPRIDIHGAVITVNPLISAVVALSTVFIVEVRHGGSLWRQRYERGRPVTGVERVRSLEPQEITGIDLHLEPDRTIFEYVDWDAERLRVLLRDWSALLTTHTFTLHDQRTGSRDTFHQPHGLAGLIEILNAGRDPVHPVISGAVTLDMDTPVNAHRIWIGVAFQVHRDRGTILRAYGNLKEIDASRGTQWDGFKRGLLRSLNDYGQQVKTGRLSWRVVQRGLTVVVWVVAPNLFFVGSMSSQLANPQVRKLTEWLVMQAVRQHLPAIHTALAAP